MVVQSEAGRFGECGNDCRGIGLSSIVVAALNLLAVWLKEGRRGSIQSQRVARGGTMTLRSLIAAFFSRGSIVLVFWLITIITCVRVMYKSSFVVGASALV